MLNFLHHSPGRIYVTPSGLQKERLKVLFYLFLELLLFNYPLLAIFSWHLFTFCLHYHYCCIICIFECSLCFIPYLSQKICLSVMMMAT